jgi:hypothetical protein
VTDAPGPVHAYILSVPGCWALYGSLGDWKATLLATRAATTAQLLVDSYAAQHPTNPDRRNRQSVAVHLMSLCAYFEHGLPGEQVRTLMGGWTHREYPELPDRPERFEVTVREVAEAGHTDRPAAAHDWASATWEAWAPHHDAVRAWLAKADGRFTT